MNRSSLVRYTWLSIAAALATMGLKFAAFLLTGSVGLLSDALESIVNLIGALTAMIMLTIAARPPDEKHSFGHEKAEYFSSGIEGALIVVAAISIAFAAIQRLLNPAPIEQPGLGVLVSGAASAINFGVARVLARVGREQNSITLEADAKHLMTDVMTSIGVLVGIGAVVVTGWQRLDPIVALLVAANIVYSGYELLRRSAAGLMDSALPAAELDVVRAILDAYSEEGVRYHALRSRQAASRRFVMVHVLVPGDWTVHRGHQLLERIETRIRQSLTNIVVLTHLESLDDVASWQDVNLDREAGFAVDAGSRPG